MKVRPDQAVAVQRIARVLGLTGSDVVRWSIDNGIQAVEGIDTYQLLKDPPHED